VPGISQIQLTSKSVRLRISPSSASVNANNVMFITGLPTKDHRRHRQIHQPTERPYDADADAKHGGILVFAGMPMNP
jgi:hypothetical protein